MTHIRQACFTLWGILLALAAGPAFAGDCAQWDVSGDWVFIQTNNTAVSLDLKSAQTGFTGQANFGQWKDDDFWLCNTELCGRDYVRFSGPAVGTINGNTLELTVYWSDNAIGVYKGQISPQGLIVGTTYDQNNPQSSAEWHSNHVAVCKTLASPSIGSLRLGRVQPAPGAPAAPATMCEMAASARARNSPAAPALEKRCAEQGGASGAPPPVAFARQHTTGPLPTICDAAKSARARNSPAAPGLERQCNALATGNGAPAPVGPPAGRYPPVLRPNDLVVGRISYSQEGQPVAQAVVGTPIAISCGYVVNEGGGPFAARIQPWRGVIQVGGQVPETWEFLGDPQGGEHEARQIWTPTVVGTTPITCILNPGFEDAEATAGNNRSSGTIEVVAPGDAPPPGQ